MTAPHVVQVVYSPSEKHGLIGIRASVGGPISYYGAGEAPSSAVCLALATASRQVARYELPSGDGFTVCVQFVDDEGKPLKAAPVVEPPLEGGVVRIQADHPAWNAIDDDDWNGATFGTWLGRLKGKTVFLWPPPDYGDRLGRFLAALMRAGVERIVAGPAAEPPEVGGFCADCHPLAENMELALNEAGGKVREALDMLKLLADAAEKVFGKDSDIVPAEDAMEFEIALGAARHLLKDVTS